LNIYETRVRFAPSPTGHVHIGNIRAAIFNWLCARHCGGKFLLRIEDTDRERSTAEAVTTLIDSMKWLELNWDEEILFQSTRLEEHKKSAEILLSEKKAVRLPSENAEHGPVIFIIPYHCGNIPFVRKKGDREIKLLKGKEIIISATGANFTYEENEKPIEKSASLAGFHKMKLFDDAENPIFDLDSQITEISSGKVFKFSNASKMSFERREVFFTDKVKGELSKPLDSIKDFVIVRSDGTPVFHLANVCDDIFQNVNFIIRGDDHVENTFRHLFLFNALSFIHPDYAHLPMIVNQNGKPYSKRDGDAYIGDFREKGFLPEALFNYLVLLGWSPGDDREKMTRNDIISAFSLDRVKSSPAKFDIQKLLNMNGLFISEMTRREFAETSAKFANPEWISEKEHFAKIANLMQSRTKTFAQVRGWNYFFSDSYDIDSKEFEKTASKDGVMDAMRFLASKLEEKQAPDELAIEELIKHSEEKFNVKKGQLSQALRLAVTGTKSGAGIPETINAIGLKKTSARILAQTAPKQAR
jgi:glutamyl-tRNA synthetase